MNKTMKKSVKQLKKGKEKFTGFMAEFKKFIQRGNVIDLAVGVVVGNAFGKIVTSIVNDVLMPLLGLAIGGLDFSKLSIKFKDATIPYGNFIQNVVDFLIVAFCIFVFVKVINNFFKKKEEEKPAPAPEPVKSDEVLLLEEIRDLLKKKK